MRITGAARLLVVASLALACAAVFFQLRSTSLRGGQAALVNVLWADGTDASRQAALERELSLVDPASRADGTLVYTLLDTSIANIRALVTHPEVRDTHHIDRSAFTLAPTAVRVRLDPAESGGRRAALTASALWAATAAAAAAALLLVVAPRRAHAIIARVPRALWNCVPPMAPEASALFRIVFGGAVVALFWLSPIGRDAVPDGPLPEDTSWLTRMLAEPFVARPQMADWISPWLAVSGLLFVAGVLTRLSFAAFALGAVAWGVVYLLQSGHHPFSALLVALLCLVPSRWGDRWSVDSMFRRGRPDADPREHGYSIWSPGVVFGLALAGAGISKLIEGGVGWALNGTVKYHFIVDAENAPVDWGVRVAGLPLVAIVLSGGAILVETLVLPAAFIGSWPLRLAAAVAASGMLLGFWLFQGIFWPAWWVLLLALLPWDRIARVRQSTDPRPSGRWFSLRHAQLVVLTMAIAQQAAASMWHLEMPPIVSAYDMYSRTYGSPEDFIRATAGDYSLSAVFDDGRSQSCPLSRTQADIVDSIDDGDGVQPDAMEIIRACFGDTDLVRTVAMEQEQRHIDWNEGRDLGTVRVRVSESVSVRARP